jgi:hypothetical protein
MSFLPLYVPYAYQRRCEEHLLLGALLRLLDSFLSSSQRCHHHLLSICGLEGEFDMAMRLHLCDWYRLDFGLGFPMISSVPGSFR